MYKDVLLFNPGSPISYKRPYIKKKEPSVGFLTIKEDQIEGEIVYLGTGRFEKIGSYYYLGRKIVRTDFNETFEIYYN